MMCGKLHVPGRDIFRPQVLSHFPGILTQPSRPVPDQQDHRTRRERDHRLIREQLLGARFAKIIGRRP